MSVTQFSGYQCLLEEVLKEGVRKENRTGVDSLALFGASLKFDLEEGFPLYTQRELPFNKIASELLWFLDGGNNVKKLHQVRNHIWDKWADQETGELGRIYGVQWRDWRNRFDHRFDQIRSIETQLRETPNSRRMIVLAWNPGELSEMALPPCHMLHQLHTEPMGPNAAPRLHMTMYQRSADLPIGVLFNIASYALLLSMYAQVHGYRPGTLTMFFGDAHIYVDQIEGVQQMLDREPRESPRLMIEDHNRTSVLNFVMADFWLHGYHPHPPIKMPVAV